MNPQALLSLSLLLAFDALAQESLVWSGESLHSTQPTVFPVALEPLSDGGSLWVGGISGAAHSGARPQSWRFVRRDANGAALWEDTLHLTAFASEGGFSPFPGFCAGVDASGVSAVAVQRTAECHVARYSPAGVALPPAILQSSNPALLIEPLRIDVDSQMQARVCAHESSLFAHPSASRASVTQLDAAGQTLWRFETPGQDAAFTELASGDVMIAASHALATRLVDVVRLTPAGAAAAQTTVDLGQSVILQALHADPISGGSLLVASAGTAGFVLAGLRADGSLAWTTMYAGPIDVDAVTFDVTSGLAFIARSASFLSDPNLIAFDGSGNLVLERRVGQHGRYLALAPRVGGGVLTLSTGFSSTFVGSVTLHEVDAAGNALGSTVLDERPGQRVTNFGRSVALHSEEGRTLAAAGFRDYSHIANGVTRFHRLLHGAVGSSYCPQAPNSTGAPSTLRGAGSPLLGEARFALVASDLPPGSLGMFLVSQSQASVQMPGGSAGTLCLGGAIGRFASPGQVRAAGPEGNLALEWDPNTLPQPTGFVTTLAGQTWSFQAWHRDAVGTTTSNFTNGLEVQLQ